MDKHSVEVDLLGCAFSIQSDRDAGYLRRVVADLGGRIREIQGRFPSYEPLKLALLAGLNLVDELQRCLEARGSSGDQEIQKIAEGLIEKIDRTLADS